MQPAFSTLETFIQGQNEQLPWQQMHPDRYKQSRLWFLRADPRGLSEGKKPQGAWAADLTLPLCTSTALSYRIMINTNKIVSDRSAWPDAKGNMTPSVTRILCAVLKVCSIFTTETLSSWPRDKTGLSSLLLTGFLGDVIPLNSEVFGLMLNQWPVNDTLRRCCNVSSPEVTSALTVCRYLISDCS